MFFTIVEKEEYRCSLDNSRIRKILVQIRVRIQISIIVDHPNSLWRRVRYCKLEVYGWGGVSDEGNDVQSSGVSRANLQKVFYRRGGDIDGNVEGIFPVQLVAKLFVLGFDDVNSQFPA